MKVSLRNEGQIERPAAWAPGQEVRLAWAPEDSRIRESDGGAAP